MLTGTMCFVDGCLLLNLLSLYWNICSLFCLFFFFFSILLRFRTILFYLCMCFIVRSNYFIMIWNAKILKIVFVMYWSGTTRFYVFCFEIFRKYLEVPTRHQSFTDLSGRGCVEPWEAAATTPQRFPLRDDSS